MRLKSNKEILTNLGIIEAHVNEYLYDKCSLNLALITNQIQNMTSDGSRFIVKRANQHVSKQPFVMCIYPHPEVLENMAHPLMNAINDKDDSKFIDKWSGIREWVIEIDERILLKGSPIRVDNGGQFCALLCHELNHAVYTHPVHLVYNYKLNKARIDMYQKMLSDKASVSKLFLPMFVCIDGLRIVLKKPVNQAREMQADLHVPDEYKPHMIEYIDRHILSNPLIMSKSITTNEEFDNEQNAGVMFSAECIRQMKQRRSMVSLELEAQYRLQPNGYFKEILQRTIKSISGKDLVTENIDYTRERYITEKLNNDITITDKEVRNYTYTLETKTVDERDIIMLTVDADSISTTTDKTYVLNNCFDYLDILNKQRNKILSKTKEKDPAKLAELTADVDKKITRVNEVIDSVMKKKVSYQGDHYGLFVKYPEGYEG